MWSAGCPHSYKLGGVATGPRVGLNQAAGLTAHDGCAVRLHSCHPTGHLGATTFHSESPITSGRQSKPHSVTLAQRTVCLMPDSHMSMCEGPSTRQHSHLAKLRRRSEDDSANEGGARGLFGRRSACAFARMIPCAPSTAREATNIRCRAPPVTPVCSSPSRPARRAMRGSTEAC